MTVYDNQRRRGFNIVGLAGLESCKFPTDSYKFSTKKIVGAQNFPFASKFPQMEIFNPKFCILEQFSDRVKFREKQLPPSPARCHDAIDDNDNYDTIGRIHFKRATIKSKVQAHETQKNTPKVKKLNTGHNTVEKVDAKD